MDHVADVEKESWCGVTPLCPTPTPKTSLSSSPPSGCSRSLAGRRCRRWRKPSARPARSAARRRARWCWCPGCARRWMRLNPALPPEAITAAVDELTRDRSAMSLEAANREVYLLLKEGIKVSVPDRERGGQKTERLRVIDWEHPANNDFLLVSQFSVTGALYTCRPDLVGFVNGLPLVVIELKKPGVPARAAFDENLTHYKQQDPGAVLVQRAAHRLERHGQPRRLAHGGLGAVLRVETHRARGRAAPGVAGGDASRDVRPGAAARPGGELHAVLRAQGRAGEGPRAEPPVPRRQQRHRLDARGAPARATGAAACSGRPRAAARASRWCSSPRRCCARCRATGHSWSSPTAWNWTTRSPRPSRLPAR